MATSYPDHHGPAVTLVATKLPPGWRLFETAGQSNDADRLVKYARRCGDCPKRIRVVTAESVGLEWHVAGQRKDWSESYRQGRFVCLVPS